MAVGLRNIYEEILSHFIYIYILYILVYAKCWFCNKFTSQSQCEVFTNDLRGGGI